MNKFTQHIPTFCEDFEPIVIEFDDIQELLQNPLFNRHRNKPDFNYFAMDREYLMAISDDEFRWFPMGRIEKPEEIDLPKWAGSKYRATLDGEDVVLTSKEVAWVSVGWIKLRDGRIAKERSK